MQQGDSTYQANVADDGAFTAEGLKPAVETLITITMPGYYDKELLRPAGQMTGDWDAGTITGFFETGGSAGLSHKPAMQNGKQRYRRQSRICSRIQLEQPSFTLKRNGAELKPGEKPDG